MQGKGYVLCFFIASTIQPKIYCNYFLGKSWFLWIFKAGKRLCTLFLYC